MISSNTRASRSRYPSPGQPAQGGGPLEANRSSGNEASRAFMRKWMEPAVQNKASYEEAGLGRYGVLENMQPLGSLPKGSARKGSGQEGGGPVRKIILRPSGSGGRRENSAGGAEAHRHGEATQLGKPSVPQGGSSGQSPAIITPSPPLSSPSLSPTISPSRRSPHHQPPHSSTSSLRKSASKTSSSRDSNEQESSLPDLAAPSSARRSTMKDADDDYQPKVSTKRAAATRSPVTRRSLTRASEGRQSLPRSDAAVAHAPEGKDEPGDAEKMQQVVGKVVNEAVKTAMQHRRYPSAFALRTLYAENTSDPRVMTMFEDVFLQRADADTIDQFTALVTEKKRQGARNDAAYGQWLRTETVGSKKQPVSAPYDDLLKQDVGEDTREQKRKKTTHADSPSLSRSRRSGADSGATNGKATTAAGGDTKTPTTPKKRRTRSDSMDSDSSLSSLASFDTPSVNDAVSPIAVAKTADRPRTQIKLKFHSSQAKTSENRAERGQKSLASDTPAGGTPGAGQGVGGASGAPGGAQPMAGRGKTAVAQQRKSPATTGPSAAWNPAPADAPKNKNRDTLSPLSCIPPQTPTLLEHHHTLGLRDAAGPHENDSSGESRDMPGAVAPLFPNLPVKTSGLRTALQPDTPDGDAKRRASRGAAGRTEDRAGARDASVASETRARSETPASVRRTRNAARSGAASTPVAGGSATRSTRSAVKRAHDDMERTASPTASVFRSNAPSEAPTRASTPVLPPPSKRQRTGPRVKSSPKKSGNTAAGIPRPSGEAVHLPGAGAVANRDQIENDDYCSSCGGSGELICCDSCTKSFHFECVDLVGSAELPDDWFCNDCIYRRSAQRADHGGPFGPLLNNLEKTIPRAFSLPKKVQVYFEDIKAGVNGEYEEIDRTKTSKKEKNQEFDWYQQRDADGNSVLCHGCQKAAAPDKLILPCSACPMWWHLDCLDIPAAHPPNPRRWVCPAHVDRFFDESASLGRRFRKVRGAQVVRPLYRRGNRNNGVIEVEDSEGDGDASGWNDVRTYGRVVRLPARGIKLDFIEQLRKIGAGRVAKDAAVSTEDQAAPSWNVDEAEAAVTLCQLHDVQPVAETSVAETSVAAEHNNTDKPTEPKAPDALALLAQLRKGQLAPDTLGATDKQALRAMMDSIKTALGEEQVENSVNDGIYDGASTTPEGSEEAVTPRAEVDKVAEGGREEGEGMRNGVEVVEGEGERGGEGQGEGETEVGVLGKRITVKSEGPAKDE